MRIPEGPASNHPNVFVIAHRKLSAAYSNRESSEWQDFVLGQLFQEEDEVEYAIEDAKQVSVPLTEL